MQIKTDEQNIKKHLEELNNYIKSNHTEVWTKYVRLGSQTVRLISYSDAFTPLVERQLTYTLTDHAEHFDATLIVWQEGNLSNLINHTIIKADPALKLRMRVEMLVSQSSNINMEITSSNAPYGCPQINFRQQPDIIEACDKEHNTYYYGVQDLSPEEFIKEGHIFVQFFNKITKTEHSNLVHGAVVGTEGNGVLFCARGQRGKSTLTVLSMMQGFEYVSDDYLILEKEGENLYSYPIYSIMTLSPRMYNELYDELKGKFVCNNARKDKYVINIAPYHNQFRNKYPIKVCMFPEIKNIPEPSIEKCNKGRAITQLIHSTVRQTRDAHDIQTIKKLIDFINNFEFYQINLCPNIKANVDCLRNFCNNLKNQ